MTDNFHPAAMTMDFRQMKKFPSTMD